MDERRFDQISTSLDHITRVFIERSYIFQEENLDRIKPKGFEGILLDNVLSWLFGQCATPYYFYRRKCMDIFMKMNPKGSNNESVEAYFEKEINVKKIVKFGEEDNGIVKKPILEFLADDGSTEPIFLEIYKWMKKFLTTLDFYVWVFEKNILPKDQIENFLNKSIILTATEHFLKNDVIQTINADSTQASYEMKMNNRNLDKIEALRCVITMRIIDLFGIFSENGNINNFLTTIQYQLIKLLGRLIFKPQRLNFDHRTENIIHNFNDRIIKFIIILVENSATVGTALMIKLQDKLVRYLHNFCQNCHKLFDKRTILQPDESKLSGIELITTKLRVQLTENSSLTNWDLITKSFELFMQKLFENIIDDTKRIRLLSPSTIRFACRMMKVCLKFNTDACEKIIQYCLDDGQLEIDNTNTTTIGDQFLKIYKIPVLELFITNMEETIRILVTYLTNPQTTQMNRLRIINIITEINKFIYNNRSNDFNFLEDALQTIVTYWPHILSSIMEVDNELNRVDLSIIDFVKHIAMICPYDLHLIGQRFEKFREWLLNMLQDKNYSLDIKSKGLFLIPCIVSSNTLSNDDLTSALKSIQINDLPLRSNEFSEGSVKRAKYVAFLKTIFQALLTSKSPSIYRFVIDATINNDEKFLLESLLQKTQRDLMESLTEKQQEVILNQTFDLFLNANYDPVIRLNIVSRYLLTLMKNSHVETTLEFIKQRFNQIWNLLVSKFEYNSIETDLINGSGAFVIIEAFYASVPYSRIETSSFSYGGNLSNGKTLTNNLIIKARNIRNDTPFHINSDANILELFRKFHCYGYRALAVSDIFLV